MAYERIADSLFEKYSSSGSDKGKAKTKGKKNKKEKPVLAEYTQLQREPEAKSKKKKKEGSDEEFPQTVLVRIAGMSYRFRVDSEEEKEKTLKCAKVANDLLNETLSENPMIPTNQALILAYMEACFRWQNLLHSEKEEIPKEAPLLPLELYCKENNIPMEEL